MSVLLYRQPMGFLQFPASGYLDGFQVKALQINFLWRSMAKTAGVMISFLLNNHLREEHLKSEIGIVHAYNMWGLQFNPQHCRCPPTPLKTTGIYSEGIFNSLRKWELILKSLCHWPSEQHVSQFQLSFCGPDMSVKQSAYSLSLHYCTQAHRLTKAGKMATLA